MIEILSTDKVGDSRVDINSNFADLDGFLYSMSDLQQSLTLVVSTTHVYLDVEAIGGGDITWNINGTDYTLDCTTGSGVGGKARVELTQGTATAPVRNVVYVAYNATTSALELFSSIAQPTGAYAPIALATIQDYTTVTANGPLMFQRTTEAVEHNDKGSISWMREKLRAIGAKYWFGIDQSLSITTNAGSEDDVDFSTTDGQVFQLHRQSWPAYSIGTDGIFVGNASGDGVLTNYQKLTDLNLLKESADGSAISDGDMISVVIWGSMNYNGDSKLFVNLPTGFYTDETEAQNDSSNYSVTTIPAQFNTTGFLIAKLVLKYNTADSGTWTNVLTATTDVWNSEAKTGIHSTNYPADYPNNDSVSDTLTKAGASKVRVHFDAFNTEAGYDFVTITDASDVVKYTYDGNLGSFTSGEVAGTTLKVKFTSDGSERRPGYNVDALDYAVAGTSGAEIVDLRGLQVGYNLAGASGGGGAGGQLMINPSIYVGSGVITTGEKFSFIVKEAFDLADVEIESDIAPTGSSIKVDIRRNGTASTDSVFTSDTEVEIPTSQSATHGKYKNNSTAIDNGSFAVGDLCTGIVTQGGSTIAGSNLVIKFKKS